MELEIAQLIIDTIFLRKIKPEDIEPEAKLFAHGLELDSVEAVQISLAISDKYGFELRTDDANNRLLFTSLRALSRHVEKNRVEIKP